jgi:AcrR family transcriptional regulator
MKKSEASSSRGNSTSSRIIEEAVRLFSEKGYHGTSIDDITEATGITKGAFYWHFRSKEDLLRKFLEDWETRFLDGLIQAVEGTKGGFLSKLQEVNRYTGAFGLYNRALSVSFTTLSAELVGGGHRIEKEFRQAYTKYQNFLITLVNEGKRENVLRKELDSNHTSLILMAFHSGLLLQWSMNRDHIDGKAFLATYRAILADGILVHNT